MAITNAQQYKQLLAKGGRTGFFLGGNFSTASTRDAQRGSTGRERGADRNRSQSMSTGRSKSTGPSFSNQGSGDDNRQTYSAIQTQTGKVKGGGAPIIGSGGEIIGYEDSRPSQTAIDNSRKFKEEQKKERKEAIKKSKTFNPFPIATSAFDKISNSKLAKFNNRFQRNNYLRSLNADQQVALLEALAEEEEIGTDNPMGIDRNIQRGMGTYNYLDPEQIDKGFLGTGIGAGKFVTDIEFGGKDAKDTINKAMTQYNEDLASGLLDNDASVVLGDDQPGLTYDEYLDSLKTSTGGGGGENNKTHV